VNDGRGERPRGLFLRQGGRDVETASEREPRRDTPDERRSKPAEILAYVITVVIVLLCCWGGLKAIDLTMKLFVQLFVLKGSSGN